MTDVYNIAWENKKSITQVEKKATKMVSDLRNEYEQLSRRNEFDIEEKVRKVMYESIQEHNISRNKIMDQTKAHLIRAVDEKISQMHTSFDQLQEKFATQQEVLDGKIGELNKSARNTRILVTKYG